jgi:hypothetical protein
VRRSVGPNAGDSPIRLVIALLDPFDAALPPPPSSAAIASRDQTVQQKSASESENHDQQHRFDAHAAAPDAL